MYESMDDAPDEARERDVMAGTGSNVSAHEAEIELRFGKVYGLKEVAEMFGISLRQVQAHVDDGSLVAVNVGRGDERRDLRVLEGDLEGFVRRRKTAAVTAAAFARPKTRTRAVTTSTPSSGYAERRAARLAQREGL
ncbi:helix-turn-helix protein [Methylorubrum extorquens]